MGKFTKRFTEDQEKAILSIYFTNPHGAVSFIRSGRDFGPEEMAALGAKYSRSDKHYQAKFLELIERDNDLDMGFINELVLDPTAINRFSIGSDSIRKDAARFHQRWSLGFSPEEKDEAIRGFGDDSVKDGANIGYHVEGVLDNDNKIVTANPRNRPQVVSTRYLDRKKVLEQVERNPDILASKYSIEIIEINRKLGEAYVRFTDICSEFIEKDPLNLEFKEKAWLSPSGIESELVKWKDGELRKDAERTFSESELSKKRESIRTKREKDYPGYARKTVFDSTRYLLTAATPTSMFVASDARTLEDDITNLLSSPLLTAQQLGNNLLSEGRKLMPTLLGEKTHAKKSDFIVKLRTELTDFVRDKIEAEKDKKFEVTQRTNFLDGVPSYNDAQLAASVVFPYSNCSLEQLYWHFERNPKDISSVVDIILKLRGKFDQDPLELLHGGLMRENLIDYGGYRDIQRHRRGFKTRQLLTAYHGIDETPELFTMAGLENEYLKLMNDVQKNFRNIAEDNPYVAQLAVPFAFKIRTLYSWQFGQDLFFAKLRSGEGGIMSYRKVAWDVEKHDREIAPRFSALFRVNRTTYPANLINLKEAKDWYNREKRQ